MHPYWHKQITDKPLFPDLLWSRPENRAHAGKLLIVGGNLHGFAAPAEAYMEAGKAGVGSARVILPAAVRAVAGNVLETVDYAASTPSGSFSQEALGEIITQSMWADGVLLAGDMGRNSETAICIEKFLTKYKDLVLLTKDAVDYALSATEQLVEQNRVFVVTMAQLQTLAIRLRSAIPVVFSMDLIKLVEFLHQLTAEHEFAIAVRHLDQMLVAHNGQVSTTKTADDPDMWRVKTAAYASVWAIQNPIKLFEALTTAIFEVSDIKKSA